MIAYAAAATSKRNIEGLRADGWRMLYSALELRHRKYTPDFRYALDNGAWTAHTQDRPFDVDAFRIAVDELGRDADWVVAPDIVGGGLESLEMSREWLSWLKPRCKRILLAVQDGMPPDVDLSGFDGVAIGGTTDWKLAQLRHRGWREAVGSGQLHILRVNSLRRLRMCAWAGADSFDGSGPTKWTKHRERMQRGVDEVNYVPPLLAKMRE